MNDRRLEGEAFCAIAAGLEERLRSAKGEAWPEGEFDRLASAVLRYQMTHNRAYGALCARRGLSPDASVRWQDAPLVPTLAFKQLDLLADGLEPEAVFLTSGTTAGARTRGRHPVPRLSLYRAALLGPFRRYVTAGEDAMPFLSLVPSADELPDSSLSYMVTAASEALASEACWLVDGRGRLDLERLRARLSDAAREAEPVLVLGTALSLLHLLERVEGRPLPPLPEGSRVMETGGFKGVRRAISREALHRGISETLGVPPGRIVNEYGMTELLSQLYEPVLEEGPEAAGVHVAPPWLRARALDPVTLDPLPDGEDGLLAFFDLANLGSVSHVLTEDVGCVTGGRVRLRGRTPGAEPRGCSRAMDEVMSAAGEAG